MEWLDLVDEQGLPTGETAERSRVHREGLRHRTAHVWLVRYRDGAAQVLLQKRSRNKDSHPGQLDTSSAGHIPAGCEPAASAVRELQEELGVEAQESDLRYIGQFRIQYEREFHGAMFRDNEVSSVYMLELDRPAEAFCVQEEEIECVEWQDLDAVLNALARHDEAYCVPRGGIVLLKEQL